VWVKPRLRGRLHQLAAVAAVPAAIALTVHASSAGAHIGAVVYGMTLFGLFGISAAYHVHAWSPPARARMKTLDHCMIYVFIAGTYTPLCLGVLTGLLAPTLLIAVWLGATVGVLLQFWPQLSMPRTGSVLYIVLGWLALVGLPQLVQGLDRPEFTLLVAGGVVYTLGSIVLGTHRPDPVPTVFGYHEVWHAMVVLACVCHYVMLWWLL
jgi:hemolysin III